ncbi:MAG: DUF3570 domain-containing protein [Methylococcales bacterium]|nr:DUF3570 domain-containing protein [Methylococcales bacterium]MDD5754474.1 DUF3570 domain-containing protein [Methylococcales bacterium]
MKHNKTTTVLAKLNLAALALTGVMQDANAGRVEENYSGDFQYGHYSESGNRMSIDIFDMAVSTPIGKNMTFSGSAVRDVISGASPQYSNKNGKGQIVQTLSGASGNAKTSPCGSSICDQRDGVNSALTYFFDNAALNFGGGFSQEQDYTSRFANSTLSWDFNKKLTTLNLGGSVAFDVIEPTNTNRDCNSAAKGVGDCHKTSQQYLLGVSQIIDRNSLLQLNMTYSYSDGYLSDPYKQVYFYATDNLAVNDLSGISTDKRPRQKTQFAWLAQYVHNFEALNNAALHADYRFAMDDWGVNSHTTELSWHQPIGAGWQVIPRFRYYSQDSANFYSPIFVGNKKDFSAYSSDYRLAGFGAISGGLKIAKTFTELHKSIEQMKLQAGVEYYDHSASYQLGGNSLGSFTDFSYYLVNASINFKF